MRNIGREEKQSKLEESQGSQGGKTTKAMSPNKVVRKKNFIPVGKNRKLSPLSNNKVEGVELVNLLAKYRNYPPRIPLSSTDVTVDHNITGFVAFY